MNKVRKSKQCCITYYVYCPLTLLSWCSSFLTFLAIIQYCNKTFERNYTNKSSHMVENSLFLNDTTTQTLKLIHGYLLTSCLIAFLPSSFQKINGADSGARAVSFYARVRASIGPPLPAWLVLPFKANWNGVSSPTRPEDGTQWGAAVSLILPPLVLSSPPLSLSFSCLVLVRFS